MRIVIDMQGIQTGSRLRGIGRYTFSLVQAIIKNKKEHEIVLFLNSFNLEALDLVNSSLEGMIDKHNIKICYLPEQVHESDDTNLWRREVAEKIREDFLYQLKPDFILITSLFEGYAEDFICSINQHCKIPTAVIFYDLIPLMNEELYLADEKINRWYRNKVIQCENAQLLLSISDSAREEAIEYLTINTKNVINISTASEDKFQVLKVTDTEEDLIRKKFNISKAYLMYSGATDERKNHLRLIESFSQLPKEIQNTHQLVFAGGMPPEHKHRFELHAKKNKLDDNTLIFTGRITDAEMSFLYNLCKAFIFPSWHEGFGLPALEAMQCGKAVIASNTSSLPEVIGLEEALFDPYDTYDISKKVQEVLTDEDFRIKLEKHALVQSKKFSWDITSKRAIVAMEEYLKTMNTDFTDTFDGSLIENIANIPSSCSDIDLIRTANSIYLNNRKPYIYVDISEFYAHNGTTGIQRVVRNIINNLQLKKLEEYDVKYVYSIDGHEPYSVISGLEFKKGKAFYPSGEHYKLADVYKVGDIFLGLDFHDVIVYRKQEFYKQMRNLGIAVYFVVYDLLPITLSHFFQDDIKNNYLKWLYTIVNSDGLICISKSIKQELKEWMQTEKISYDFKKLHSFHLGADSEYSVSSKGFQDNYKLVLAQLTSKISFLMVGTLEPRKGHHQVLEAFEELWKDELDVNLVFVGKEGWLVDELIMKIQNHQELNKRLFWLDGISDEYLEKVYASSACLIAASEGEGFGLPLIEAAQHEIPIIARDIPVFREVAGAHACYFQDDKESSVIVDTIQNWLELYKNDKHTKSDDMPWLTWKESTEQLLKCLDLNTKGSENI